jgi:hypothetical protein
MIEKTCLQIPGGWFRQKMMLSAYFSRTDFVSIEFLLQWQENNLQFFTETILPRIVESLSVCHSKLKPTAAHLHIDNAKSHNSRLSIQKKNRRIWIHLSAAIALFAWSKAMRLILVQIFTIAIERQEILR